MDVADAAQNAPHGKKKTVTIIVNGRAKTLPKKEEISFDEVVEIAFPGHPTGDGIQYTVQYTRGQGNKPAGTLVEGQSVKIKDGMEFDVTSTNRS
ncbi:multiubiquitin domain-containing protein [Mesorhizobium sp. M0036]|uniref:multiubiquitin domain-containing protein n=1 Tax=Mesorhizobium sp. M0036 TaxID=2956853 RepID=UPI00333776CC